MCVCVYVLVCMCVYVLVCMCAFEFYTLIFVCLCVSVFSYVYTYARVIIHVYVNKQNHSRLSNICATLLDFINHSMHIFPICMFIFRIHPFNFFNPFIHLSIYSLSCPSPTHSSINLTIHLASHSPFIFLSLSIHLFYHSFIHSSSRDQQDWD